MGGKKGKKGARKTHRKTKGGWASLGMGTLTDNDWVSGFTARRVKNGITAYRLMWVPTVPAFVIDFEGMGSMATAISGTIIQAVKDIVIEKFYNNDASIAPAVLNQITTSSKVVFIGDTAGNVVKCVLVNSGIGQIIENDPTKLAGAFATLTTEYKTLATSRNLIPVQGNPGKPTALAAIGLANALQPVVVDNNGELVPPPPMPLDGPAPMLGKAAPVLGATIDTNNL
jgi:hypothetical protein